MLNVDVTPAMFEDKAVVRRLLQLYIHDLSAFMDLDVDEHGSFGTATSTTTGPTRSEPRF